MTNLGYLEKPVSIALSSKYSVDSLYQMQVEVAKLYSQMIQTFSGFFIIIQKTENRQLRQTSTYTQQIRSLSKPTATNLPSPKQSMQAPIMQPQQLAPVPSFILNIATAQKALSNLVRKPLNQQGLPPVVATQQTPWAISQTQLTPLPEETILFKIAELEASLESKISPSLKSMSYAIKEYERKVYPTVSTSPQTRTAKLSSVSSTTTLPLAPRSLAVELTKSIPKYVLPLTAARALSVFSAYQFTDAQTTNRTDIDASNAKPISPAKKTVSTQQPNMLASQTETDDKPIQIQPHALQAIGFASVLSALISSKNTQPTKQSTQLSKIASPVPSNTSKPPAPQVRSSSRFGTLGSMPIGSPPLIVNVSQSPISSSKPLGHQKFGAENQTLGSPAIGTEENQAKPKQIGRVAVSQRASDSVFDFTAYAVLGSFIAKTQQTLGKMLALADEDMPLINPSASQALIQTGLPQAPRQSFNTESSLKMPPYDVEDTSSYEIQVKPKEIQFVPSSTKKGLTPQKQTRAKPLGTLVLAGIGTMMVHQLQTGMAGFQQATQESAAVFEEAIASRSVVGSLETAENEAMAEVAENNQLQSYSNVKPRAPLSLPSLVSAPPIVQDTINITVTAETAEEDLRDLERKINRILSEQLSRYYGSSRVEGS